MSKNAKGRDRIISAFIDLLYEKRSLDNVNIKEITERSKTAPTTFFYHFKSKKILLKTSLNIVWGEINQEIKNKLKHVRREYFLDHSYPKAVKVCDVFSAISNFIYDNKKLGELIFLKEVENLYTKEYVIFIRFINELIDEGVKKKFFIHGPTKNLKPPFCKFLARCHRNTILLITKDLLKMMLNNELTSLEANQFFIKNVLGFMPINRKIKKV